MGLVKQKKPKQNEISTALSVGRNGRGDTSGCGTGRGARLDRLFRPFVIVGNGHRGDKPAGLFEVLLLDEDLELGHSVDGQGIDERGRPAADDGGDAVAFEEALDHVRFERAEDPSELGEVGVVLMRRVTRLSRTAVVVFGHGRSPFLNER